MGLVKSKCSLHKGAHRNGFNDTISHEVSPKTISLLDLFLKGVYFPLSLLGPIPLPVDIFLIQLAVMVVLHYYNHLAH
jgi:hypothetical protein